MSNMTGPRRTQFARRNTQKQCSTPGCTQRRCWTNATCQRCKGRIREHGHPQGFPLSRPEVEQYESIAYRLIDSAPDHPAITQAVKVVELFLEHPDQCGVTDSTCRELWRLWSSGLRGREALARIVGVVLFAHYQARRLPDDERLTFAIANTLLKARRLEQRYVPPKNGKPGRTRPRQIGKAVREELGGWVRDRLSGFLANVIRAANQQHQQRQQEIANQAKPLTFPDA